jgi:hypothetical protein
MMEATQRGFGAAAEQATRFDEPERLRRAVAGWGQPDYFVLAEIRPDGSEVQRVRRKVIDGEDPAAVALALPAGLAVETTTPARVYGMACGGKRLGKARAAIVPGRTHEPPACGTAGPTTTKEPSPTRPPDGRGRAGLPAWRPQALPVVVPPLPVRAAAPPVPAPHESLPSWAPALAPPLWPAASPDLLAELASLRAENAGLLRQVADLDARSTHATERAVQAETETETRFLRAENERLRRESVELGRTVADLRAENAGLAETLGEANEMLAETGRYVTPMGELFKRRR